MIYEVRISKRAAKDVRQLPSHIRDKLAQWIDDVHRDGLEYVRRIPGYHDEQLHGERKGQRSIRLSRSYRAIYRILEDRRIEFVQVEEVSKHEY